MEWFLVKTVHKLPGVFRSAFWSTLLPQASLSEPAVLHAVLTLCSVHKRLALEVDQPDTTELFTLQQYTRATSTLRERMEKKSPLSNKVTLIVCAIFVHLEYLRGCHQTALTHLRHGLQILDEWLPVDHLPEPGSRDTVDEWILQTFSTLFVQAQLLGQDVGPHGLALRIRYHLPPVCESFQSLGQARQALEDILLRILELLGQLQPKRHYSTEQGHRLSPSDLRLDEVRANIQLKLDFWLQACEMHVPSSAQKAETRSLSSDMDRFAWKLLLVYHTLACAMLARCFLSAVPDTITGPRSQAEAVQHTCSPRFHSDSTNQTSSPLTPFFLSILTQCEHLFKLVFGPMFQTTQLPRTPIDRDKSDVIADIGWIPLLYYTALYAREPDIRREATRLLRLSPHREGIWDSLLAAAVAEKILDMEQVIPDVCEGRLGPATENLMVRNVHVKLPEGPDGWLLLNYTMHSNQGDTWIEGQSTYDIRLSCWTKTRHERLAPQRAFNHHVR